MKLKTLTVLFVLSIIALQSCKNDIDINAPWKETAVVYGFLDAHTPKQYIRITKTFQTSPSTSPDQVAQITDSLYFDSLQVKLYDLTFPSISPIVFTRSNSIPKDNGYFASDVNYLYTNTINFKPNADHQYKLEIIHPSSGKAYYGLSPVVAEADIMTGLKTYVIKIDYSSGSVVLFNYSAAKNAAVYDAAIRYIYTENGVLDSVDQIVASGIAASESVNDAFKLKIKPTDMNLFLADYFKDKPMASRVLMNYITYVVYAGSSDLKFASDLSKPSTILLQVKPEFNNIQNGLGLFTSRSTNQLNFFFKDETSRVNMTKNVNGF
jgi:hypothetical protein